jgi:hypothetical protein
VQCRPRDPQAFASRFVPEATRRDPRFAGVSIVLRAEELAACDGVGGAGPD